MHTSKIFQNCEYRSHTTIFGGSPDSFIIKPGDTRAIKVTASGEKLPIPYPFEFGSMKMEEKRQEVKGSPESKNSRNPEVKQTEYTHASRKVRDICFDIYYIIRYRDLMKPISLILILWMRALNSPEDP